ncbi:hypothetical protein QQ045_009854 [Rhodiola kirilowii]
MSKTHSVSSPRRILILSKRITKVAFVDSDDRYWALAVPAFAIMTIISALGFYLGLNFMQTPPPTSYNTIFDEYSREPSVYEESTDGEEQPIDPMYDIGIHKIRDAQI